MSTCSILPSTGIPKGRAKGEPFHRRPSVLQQAEAKLERDEKRRSKSLDPSAYNSLTSDIRATKQLLSQPLMIDPYDFFNDLKQCRPNSVPGTPYDFKWTYLLDSIMSKYPYNESGVTPEIRAQLAIDKMLKSDDRCVNINTNGFGTPEVSHVLRRRVLGLARYWVQEIMGEFRNDIYFKSRFTGGASTLFTRARGDAFYKYNSGELSVTPRARRHVESLINTTPLWRQIRGSRAVTCVLGDQSDTVEKNAEIDRAIRKQPEGNLLLQLCIGSHLRTRLMLFGINLRDQSTNQRFAKRGSIDGSIATIDWSSASDSIATLLVHSLVSDRWYEELDMCRCSRGYLPDGSIRNWGGFSAMGNGFTFELESIIFYAITLACTQIVGGCLDDVSIYGDDTICPSEVAPLLMDVMSDLGFTPNRDKTFSTGPFRESCGKHYYDGIDVSPFYIRDRLDDHSRVCWLLNKLRAWADDGSGVCDPSVYKLWLKYRRKYIPASLLGGSNLDEVTYVVSNDPPRLRIVAREQTRPIDGIPALLRSLQGHGDQSVIGMLYKPVGFRRFYTCDSRARHNIIRGEAMHYLNTVRPSIDSQRIIDQKAALVLGIKPNKEWCTQIPLFPNEFRA